MLPGSKTKTIHGRLTIPLRHQNTFGVHTVRQNPEHVESIRHLRENPTLNA